MNKIVVSGGNLREHHRQQLMAAAVTYGYEILIFDSNEEAYSGLPGAEIIYGQGAELYQKAADAKWFCSMSAGVDSYLKEDVLRKDVLLTNSSGAFGLTIAEHTIMVVLELLRKQKEYDGIVEKREWIRSIPITSIYGSRIMVAGTGNIGVEISKRLHGFSPACCIGVNRSGRAVEDGKFTQIIRQEKMNRYLPETDILIMALPETAKTHHFLSEDRISLLPEQAYVVNVGRGSSVDEPALLRALNTGRIAGAALDVFEQEPLPKDHPAWDCRNLIITPHCSGNMFLPQTVDINVEQFCRDFEHYCRKEPMEHSVDFALEY